MTSQSVTIRPEPQVEPNRARLFSFISLNWKGKPRVNFENGDLPEGGTRTRTGPKVKAVLDTIQYETGIEISDEDIDQLSSPPKRNDDSAQATQGTPGLELYAAAPQTTVLIDCARSLAIVQFYCLAVL
jgi:hypothetical protein